MDIYKKHSPKDFFNWMSKGLPIEVRFLSDYKGNKFTDWTLIENITHSIRAESRFNSIFITKYEQLEKILLYKIGEYPATRLYNIFIGVNPRRKIFQKSSKNKLLYKSYQGSIAGTSHIQNILCDIENRLRGKSRQDIINWYNEKKMPYTEEQIEEILAPNASEAMIEECIQAAKFLVKELEITDYYINISGNGAHLWMQLEHPIELPVPDFIEYEDKLKYKMKEDPIFKWIKMYNKFVEKMDELIQTYNPKLKVDDGAKDIARVARAPGSWNVKKNKKARAVGTVYYNNIIGNILNQKFMSVLPLLTVENKYILKKAQSTNKHRYNNLNIRECPLYHLLVSKMLPSTLSRNHYLEQSFARILKDNDININEITKVIQEMDAVQGKNLQIDPDYLEDEGCFNSEAVNSYCIGSKVDLVYELLEDVPIVQRNIIDDNRYTTLNNYSWMTIVKLAIDGIKKPETYLELKETIRRLCDQYDKTTVFFTIKSLYKEEWEYYDRNKIIQQILNKTRRREE